MSTRTESPPTLDGATDTPFFFYSSIEGCELTFASPSIENVLGYSPEDIVGRRCVELLDTSHPLNSDHARYQRERFLTTHAMSAIRVVFDANQKKRYLELLSYGESDEQGKIVACHVVARDVTNRFRARDGLFQRVAELGAMSQNQSDRERQVLELVMKGRLNKSIARELNVSERTIEMDRARLMTKFNADTSAELIRLATELKILTELLTDEARTSERDF